MNETEVRSILVSNLFAEKVRQNEQLAQRYGIHGVPYFVLADKYTILGAMPVEQMKSILKKLLDEKTD